MNTSFATSQPSSALATRASLAARFNRATRSGFSMTPLSEDQMRSVAPSIFAAGKHDSRSERYTYIPTIDILRGLRHEGFEPFLVAQGHSRIPGKAAFTKHLIRLRHRTGTEALARGPALTELPEIILINSHDGASAYQMLGGYVRFACLNGMVVGSGIQDVRVPHKGTVQDLVIDGAFRVLEQFEPVTERVAQMKVLTLDAGEERALATAAMALRFDPVVQSDADGVDAADPVAHAVKPMPVGVEEVIAPRRPEDTGRDLWTSWQRIQESLVRGGLQSRSANGRRTITRPVGSIERNVSLNRALWVLAEEMRRLKA